MSDKIKCRICEAETHSIQHHLEQFHKDVNGKPLMTVADYQAKFPGAPVLSAVAEKALRDRAAAGKPAAAASPAAASFAFEGGVASTKNFHEVFGIDVKQPGALNRRGAPIPIQTYTNEGSNAALVPPIDADHIFVDVENLKNVALALDLNMPCYNWGHFGTGKTSLFEQYAARTGRPFMRVQHTIGVEEAHVLGQWTVKGGETVFQPGPLPEAMRYGWVYCADEYDMALPAVLALYQPVMEGKSLVIKDAPPEWRIVVPHPNFRMVGTGNTNGSGDESGLYSGTSIQNAANYDRWGMVLNTKYLPAAMEATVIVKKAKIALEVANKLVEFADKVRTAFDGQKVTATISPRTLINAAKVGARKGNWFEGLQCSFLSKLNRSDTEILTQVAQRIFATT